MLLRFRSVNWARHCRSDLAAVLTVRARRDASERKSRRTSLPHPGHTDEEVVVSASRGYRARLPKRPAADHPTAPVTALHTFPSPVVIDRNRWTPSIGMTGRHQLEIVDAINRCAHPTPQN